MRAALAGRSLVHTVAVLAGLVLLAACGGDSGSGSGGGAGQNSGPTTAAAGPTGPTTTIDLASRVEKFTIPPWRHVTGVVDYPQTPPVGGDHAPAWMNCGYYSQPVPPESAVHSLEHGAVWITFRPSLAQAQKDRVKALAKSRTYVLASPWTDESLPAPVVASAWGLQLKAQSADDPFLAAFVRMYAGGPQSPEPGAACTGAIGNPE